MGEFTKQLASQGAGLVGDLVGTGMGLLLEKHQDKRQLAQQQKLQDMQIQGQMQMANFNQSKQMQLWEATNYLPQVEQMKKAGLNPALIYGLGGGGGTTTNAATGNVTGAEAPKGGNEIATMIGMGIQQRAQTELLQAQKENIQADTANKKAENPNITKTGGKIEAETSNLLQGIENQKAQETLTKIDAKLKQLEIDFAKDTLQNRESLINITLSKAVEEVQILGNERKISDATVQTKIGLIKQQLALQVLDGYMKQAETKNIDQNTLESIQRVKNMIELNMREWDKMSQTNQELRMKQEQLDYNTAVPAELKELLDKIYIVPGLGKGSTLTPIKGFHNRQ